LSVGNENVFLGLRALLAGIYERTFSVNADDLSAVPGLAFLFEGAASIESRDDLVLGNCHGCGKEGGNAVLCNAVSHLLDAFGLCVTGVLAKISVNVNVHKTGRNIVAARIDNVSAFGSCVNNTDDLTGFVVICKCFANNYLIGKNDLTVDNMFKCHSMYLLMLIFIQI